MDFFKKSREFTHQQLDWKFIVVSAVAIAMHSEAYKLAALFSFMALSYYLKSLIQLLAHQNLLREKEILGSQDPGGVNK